MTKIINYLFHTLYEGRVLEEPKYIDEINGWRYPIKLISIKRSLIYRIKFFLIHGRWLLFYENFEKYGLSEDKETNG